MRAFAYVGDREGAAAVEFALVLPGLVFLIFGVINLCMVAYASVNLQSAVEQAARYASTSASASGTSPLTYPSALNVNAYAATRYKGPGITAVYAYTQPSTACGTSGTDGNLVTGSGSYTVFYGLGSVSVPLHAQACFP